MDATTFITTMVSALAWPVAIVGLVALLRPALSELLLHLQSIKVAGIGEAVFARDLAEVQRIADQTPAATPAPLVTESDGENAEVDILVRLAELAPRATVLESWGELEAAARAAVPDFGPGRPPMAGRLGELLVAEQIFDDAALRMYDILRAMRNRVAHEADFTISTDEAVEYARLARGLARGLISDDLVRSAP